jgi:hypothetical protein
VLPAARPDRFMTHRHASDPRHGQPALPGEGVTDEEHNRALMSACLRDPLTSELLQAKESAIALVTRAGDEWQHVRRDGRRTCRHVSGRLERGLVASGDRVIRVAPGLTKGALRQTWGQTFGERERADELLEGDL